MKMGCFPAVQAHKYDAAISGDKELSWECGT